MRNVFIPATTWGPFGIGSYALTIRVVAGPQHVHPVSVTKVGWALNEAAAHVKAKAAVVRATKAEDARVADVKKRIADLMERLGLPPRAAP